MFNAYQLALAAGSLVATFVWYLVGPPRLKMGLFTLLGFAGFPCVITTYIAPRIELLQRQGETHSPRFAHLHGGAMVAYLIEAVVLLIADLSELDESTSSGISGMEAAIVRQSSRDKSDACARS